MDRRQAITTLAGAALALTTAGTTEEASAHAPARRAALAAEVFPLSAVRLLDSPFRAAQSVDRAYLLRLEPDRLMAFVRENAGLKPKAPHYGGWDNGGAGTVGHYLSACSHMYAATGDTALKKRIDYLVAEMADAQKASGDDGLFAFGYDRNVYFAKMRKGDLLPNRVNGWYATHKIMAGLRDAYVEGGSAQARDVLRLQNDWCLGVTAKLNDAQWQTMLGGEHGAPHEIMADLYALDRASASTSTTPEKWRHHLVFEAAPPQGNDQPYSNGLHANENIPKFVGYERVGELERRPRLAREPPKNFWATVVGHRSWANGGDGQWEHFLRPPRRPPQKARPKSAAPRPAPRTT